MRTPPIITFLLLALAAPARAADIPPAPPFEEAKYVYVDPPTWTPPVGPVGVARLEDFAARQPAHLFRVILVKELPPGHTPGQAINDYARAWTWRGMDRATNTVIMRVFSPPRIQILAGATFEGYGMRGEALRPYLAPFEAAVRSQAPDVVGGIAGTISMLDRAATDKEQALTRAAAGKAAAALAAEQAELTSMRERLTALLDRKILSRDEAATAIVTLATLTEAAGGDPEKVRAARVGYGPAVAGLEKAAGRRQTARDAEADAAERAAVMAIFGALLLLVLLAFGAARAHGRRKTIGEERLDLAARLKARRAAADRMYRTVEAFYDDADYSAAQHLYGARPDNVTAAELQWIGAGLSQVRNAANAWEGHLAKQETRAARATFWKPEDLRAAIDDLDRPFSYSKGQLNPLAIEMEANTLISGATARWEAAQRKIAAAKTPDAIEKLRAPIGNALTSPAWFADHPLQGGAPTTSIDDLTNLAARDPVAYDRVSKELLWKDAQIRGRAENLIALATRELPAWTWPDVQVEQEHDPRTSAAAAAKLQAAIQEVILMCDLGNAQERLDALIVELDGVLKEGARRADALKEAAAGYDDALARAELALSAVRRDHQKALQAVSHAAAVHSNVPDLANVGEILSRASDAIGDAQIVRVARGVLPAYQLALKSRELTQAALTQISLALRHVSELDSAKTRYEERLMKLRGKAAKAPNTRIAALGAVSRRDERADYAALNRETAAMESSWAREDAAQETAARRGYSSSDESSTTYSPPASTFSDTSYGTSTTSSSDTSCGSSGGGGDTSFGGNF